MKNLSGADLRSMARAIQSAHGIDLDILGIEIDLVRIPALFDQPCETDSDYRKRIQTKVLSLYNLALNGGDVQPSILKQQSEKDKLDRWIIATENKIEAIEQSIQSISRAAVKVSDVFAQVPLMTMSDLGEDAANAVERIANAKRTSGASIIKDGNVDPHAIGAALTYGRAVHLAMGNITGHELKERINRDFGPGYENDHSACVTSLYNLLMKRAQDMDIKAKKEGQ